MRARGIFFALCCIFAAFAFCAEEATLKLPDSVKIVILPQDVADGYDHAGCTPDLMKPMEDYLAKNYADNFVRLDLSKLLKLGIGPYYIFNKRYCPPIGNALGANVFIMSRLELTSHTSPCADDRYIVKIKVFCMSNGAEIIAFLQKDAGTKDIPVLLKGQEEKILRDIIILAQKPKQ